MRSYLGRSQWGNLEGNGAERSRAELAEAVSVANGNSAEVIAMTINDWLGDFHISSTYTRVAELAEWLRRRVRLCYWKQWERSSVE